MNKVTPFLMFQRAQAEAAIHLYTSLFDEAEVLAISRYGPGEPGVEGSVRQAAFALHGQTILCIDSNIEHDFDFTPSFSFFVNCEDEAELERLWAALSQDGEVRMPLDNYGFSQKFGWVSDRFGVSWQLNLPAQG